MPRVYTEVEVEVTLDDFTDDDLIDELEQRGKGLDIQGDTGSEIVEQIYQKRRLGKNYDKELDDLIYLITGRPV